MVDVVLRQARAADEQALLALLPELAGFPVHARRNPDDLWQHDAKNLSAHLASPTDEYVVIVADAAGELAGMAMVRMQPEFMSHEPGAHLEAIAVAKPFRGQGLGKRLLTRAETEAHGRGATSMTLHVFNANTGARELYAGMGYLSEVQRCIKWLD